MYDMKALYEATSVENAVALRLGTWWVSAVVAWKSGFIWLSCGWRYGCIRPACAQGRLGKTSLSTKKSAYAGIPPRQGEPRQTALSMRIFPKRKVSSYAAEARRATLAR